jgi:hypothetical protein
MRRTFVRIDHEGHDDHESGVCGHPEFVPVVIFVTFVVP